MYTPAHIADADPLMVGTHGKNSLGLLLKGLGIAGPTSAVLTANRIHFIPFFTSHGYSLARWWWQNGATVGTDYIESGIYDESFRLFRASPRTLSAGTANQLQFATPGIHGTNVTSGNDNTDATVYTTASVTLKAGVLYLMSVGNAAASAGAISSIDSATGGFPTFTSRSTTQFNGTADRVSIWSAVPTADFTGTLRINYGATQTAATWGLEAFYHVDTASTDGVVQNAVGTGSSVTPLATLAAFGSANNATYGAFGHPDTNNGTASTGYLKLTNAGSTTPAVHIDTVWRPDNDTTVDETITSAQWGACAVEIKSLGTGAVYVPPMRGWLAFHCSGATATFFGRAAPSFSHLQANVFLQASATGGLPATATPASSSAGAPIINHGFTRSTSP